MDTSEEEIVFFLLLLDHFNQICTFCSKFQNKQSESVTLEMRNKILQNVRQNVAFTKGSANACQTFKPNNDFKS